MIILVCIVILITSGCVSQSPPKNTSLPLPSIYTAPIGGFEKDTAVAIDPDSTFEAEYTFYSKSGDRVK